MEVLIAPCVGCNPPFYTKAQATSRPDGSFSASAQVPPDAPIGTTLYVTGQNVDPNNPSNNGTLGAGFSLLTSFTVAAQTTPIPTAAATPTAVNTTQAGSTGGNSSNITGSSNNTVLIVLLALSNVLLLIMVFVAILLYLRLRSQSPGGDDSRSGGYVPPGIQYSGPPAYPSASTDYSHELSSLSGPQGQEWGNANAWRGDPQGLRSDDGSDPIVSKAKPQR